LKGFLITLLNDSDFALDESVFHHELHFKYETARDRGSIVQYPSEAPVPDCRSAIKA